MTLSMPTVCVHAVLLVITALTAFGQGPINDRLVVTLPHTTWVGTQSLPAGEYTIRQLPTASNPRLLEFSSDNGTKLEATVTAIASINNNNVRDTSVILEQKGGQYFLKNVWIQGKTYGYEIPVNDRQQQAGGTAERVTLTASFTPSPTQVAAAQPPQQPVAESTGTPAPPPTPAPAPAPTPEPRAAAAEPQPPAQQPSPVAETPAPAPQAPATTADDDGRLAAQTPPMPQTASQWPEALLIGIVLCAAGMILTPLPRRRRDKR